MVGCDEERMVKRDKTSVPCRECRNSRDIIWCGVGDGL
jgi:hypothetical protein